MNHRKVIAAIMLTLAAIVGPASAVHQSTVERSAVDVTHVVAEAEPWMLASPLCWHVD